LAAATSAVAAPEPLLGVAVFVPFLPTWPPSVDMFLFFSWMISVPAASRLLLVLRLPAAVRGGDGDDD
jgi:hypothetical protein